MEKLKINALAIGVTRKCNLGCKHCLKGNAQFLSVDTDAIDQFLSKNVSHIGSLCLTGGEPTLAIECIEAIYRSIVKHGITLDCVKIPTNGKNQPEKFFNLLNEIYDYTKKPSGNCVRISLDKWHFPDDTSEMGRALSQRHIGYRTAKVRGLLKFGISLEILNDDGFILSGRAKKLPPEVLKNLNVCDQPSPHVTITTRQNTIELLYISSKGNIVPNNDLEYTEEDVEGNYICHISEIETPEQLISKISAWNKQPGISPGLIDTMHKVSKEAASAAVTAIKSIYRETRKAQ